MFVEVHSHRLYSCNLAPWLKVAATAAEAAIRALKVEYKRIDLSS